MKVSEKTLSTMKFIRGTLLWFLVFYLGWSFFQERFNPEADPVNEVTQAAVVMTPATAKVAEGNAIAWTIEGEAKALRVACETGFTYVRQVSNQVVTLPAGDCPACDSFCEFATNTTDARISQTLNPVSMQAAAVTETGDYALQFGAFTSEPVAVTEAGFFRQLFRGVIKQPLFNALAALANAAPARSLGIAIIVLTLLVRLLLFLPNQRALRSQKKMQVIQPKLQEIQKKYKDDQTQLAAKTMELYKQHGVNPMSSCAPLLLQMPFLLGIYYIVQEGLSPHLAPLLYSFMADVSLNANTMFLGLDLTQANVFPMPLLVAGAQWAALRMSMSSNAGATGQAAQMQKVMQWAMPVMIGVFTATLPSGVGLYWITSTLFGLLQHWLIKRNNQPTVTVRSA